MTNKVYRYYSTQRPVDIGTFPKPAGNTVVNIWNYDGRLPIEELGGRPAWGYIEYAQPVSDADLDNYELRKPVK